MRRAFTNIVCPDPAAVAPFYETVVGLERHADFGWFIVLTHPRMENFEFGLLQRDHETVPPVLREEPKGVLLTFVVDDVEACHERAREAGADILDPPRDMPYGQCRMLVRDPAGAIVDVSSPSQSRP